MFLTLVDSKLSEHGIIIIIIFHIKISHNVLVVRELRYVDI